MISIVTVSWNSDDFLNLLIESVERFTESEYEIVVVDNSIKKNPIRKEKVKYIPTKENIGHGAGLNLGVKHIHPSFPFVLFLDVDTHILTKGWEELLLSKMSEFDIVGGEGSPAKPIRPACMFMKRELVNYDWRATEGYEGERGPVKGYDVAIKAYYKMREDKIRIGFLKGSKNRYGTLTGEEWLVKGKPIVYHHWSGTWMQVRQEKDFPNDDLFAE